MFSRCPAMDSGVVFGILIFLSLACLRSTAETTAGSVIFIDSSTHQHLRISSSGQTSQTNSMSVMEVGAAILVLLGLAPPRRLSSESSSKLNELLVPNPFARPRHVLMLEVPLAEDPQVSAYSDSTLFSSLVNRKLISDAGSVEIELPGREEVAFTLLDGPEFDHTPITAKEISDFAQSLGGSYMFKNSEPQNGELVIPFPSGLKLNLHMSKKADRKFAVGLMYIIEKIREVTEMKQDLSRGDFNVAELMGGCFDGIKISLHADAEGAEGAASLYKNGALQEEYGSKDMAQQAIDLLLATVSSIFDSLQAKYKGQIVAVLLLSNADSSPPQKVLDVTFASRPSPRWLEEVKSSSNSTVEAEVTLVRRTLAWFTGAVLLIATLIGIYLLVNMPLTRDTLLYSNVKLD
ncbi:hypothetical protein Cgig2_001830 [Carnegiea gigantea]|uniref:DUF7794 domain-containing protein n=1 Tax=Carnegiea gigantea TaxID=171969 RepID=A0A9Q1GQU1_9CARY|nr:hypothetical protein Cgig2_001830 [Carnegiea gigantea]